MKPKIATARALAAYTATKSVRLITIVFGCILAVLAAIVLALVYFYSNWWLILLLPLVVIGLLFLLLRFIVLRIVRLIYRHPFNHDQRKKLNAFSQKIITLLEARSTPPIFFAIVTVKDILLHRDVTTLRALISDSISLKADFAELEKHFGKR